MSTTGATCYELVKLKGAKITVIWIKYKCLKGQLVVGMLIDGKTAQRLVYWEQKACVLGEQEESGESLVGFNSWPNSFQLCT